MKVSSNNDDNQGEVVSGGEGKGDGESKEVDDGKGQEESESEDDDGPVKPAYQSFRLTVSDDEEKDENYVVHERNLVKKKEKKEELTTEYAEKLKTASDKKKKRKQKRKNQKGNDEHEVEDDDAESSSSEDVLDAADVEYKEQKLKILEKVPKPDNCTCSYSDETFCDSVSKDTDPLSKCKRRGCDYLYHNECITSYIEGSLSMSSNDREKYDMYCLKCLLLGELMFKKKSIVAIGVKHHAYKDSGTEGIKSKEAKKKQMTIPYKAISHARLSHINRATTTPIKKFTVLDNAEYKGVNNTKRLQAEFGYKPNPTPKQKINTEGRKKAKVAKVDDSLIMRIDDKFYYTTGDNDETNVNMLKYDGKTKDTEEEIWYGRLKNSNVSHALDPLFVTEQYWSKEFIALCRRNNGHWHQVPPGKAASDEKLLVNPLDGIKHIAANEELKARWTPPLSDGNPVVYYQQKRRIPVFLMQYQVYSCITEIGMLQNWSIA